MPARIAGICGLAAFVTVNIGWIVGGFAQPAAYSVANDDISDLGAVTADSLLDLQPDRREPHRPAGRRARAGILAGAEPRRRAEPRQRSASAPGSRSSHPVSFTVQPFSAGKRFDTPTASRAGRARSGVWSGSDLRSTKEGS
jgi:hypothetical protein